MELGLLTEPDGTLVIRVADSGPGVPPDAREKIFEPGYSTKPAGAIGERGVGLPLIRKTLERRGGTSSVGEAAGRRRPVRGPPPGRPATRSASTT